MHTALANCHMDTVLWIYSTEYTDDCNILKQLNFHWQLIKDPYLFLYRFWKYIEPLICNGIFTIYYWLL